MTVNVNGKNVERACCGSSGEHIAPRAAFRAERNAVHTGHRGQPARVWYCLILLCRFYPIIFVGKMLPTENAVKGLSVPYSKCYSASTLDRMNAGCTSKVIKLGSDKFYVNCSL